MSHVLEDTQLPLSANSKLMRVLVYGSRGWIGGQFIKLLKSHDISHHEGQARVDDYDSEQQEINAVSPTHIVSFIGRTHGSIGDKTYTTIDYLEQEGKLMDNVRDNLYSPLILALLCKEKKIHLTYLGTGCIFKFDEQHPFGEEVNGFKGKRIIINYWATWCGPCKMVGPIVEEIAIEFSDQLKVGKLDVDSNQASAVQPVSYTHLTLPTKRIV